MTAENTAARSDQESVTDPEAGAEPDARHRSRWLLPVGALAAALLVVTGLVVMVALPSPKAADKLLGYSAGCLRSPMDEVPDAQAYQVEVACARIAGTVTAYRLNKAYDDLELTVTPSRAYLPALAAANDGRFQVDIPGPELDIVTSPDLGDSGIFYGSWVENKATHELMLMPAWRITASPGSGVNPMALLFSASAARHSGQALRLSTSIPATLPQASAPAIPVTMSWLVPAAGKKHPAVVVPASQVRVLVEITGPSGQAVIWKAAETGTLGQVTIRLPLIVATGRYTCRLYAIAAGRVVAIARSFSVGKS